MAVTQAPVRADPRLIVPLDVPTLAEARALVEALGETVSFYKVGLELFATGGGMELAREPMVWWSLASAFSFMFILVLAANLFADTLRDAFDPRMG